MIKKAIALIIVIIFAASTLNGHAADENIKIPFVFDHETVNTDGRFVTVALDNNRGDVYTIDGKQVDTIPNDGAMLENSYIKVTSAGSGKWTVFTTGGVRAFDGAYDVVTVTEKNIAIVADGSWRPPGIFSGLYGAIDLTTGKTIVPMEFNELILSADNRFLLGGKHAVYPIEYAVFDLNGQDVTSSTPFVCFAQYDNGYYKVRDPKTGLCGIADKTGKLCTSVSYDELGDIVFEGAVLVSKDRKWGASTIDGSGKLLQPIEYNHGGSYENGMYVLKRYGWIQGKDDINPVEVYYGDGGLAFKNNDYNAVLGYCGDIFYVNRMSDGALVGVTKTGQIAAGPFPNRYVAFSSSGYDFVILGSVLSDGYQSPEGSIVVNRWGETIAQNEGSILSDGTGGRGLSLYNAQTDTTTRILADGTRLPAMTASPTIDYNRGWMIFNENNSAYMTDLFGNVLIPHGRYASLFTNSNTYFYLNGQTLRSSAKIYGKDLNGKFGAFDIEETPYIYPAHTWAQNDIDEAIRKGLVPDTQQRDWRDACTRADFCRLMVPLLDTYDLNGGTSVSFSDTSDPDILRLASLGIVNGTGNGKFSPNRPVTRQEAAVILARCAKALSIDATGKTALFADSGSFASWAVDGISFVNGIVCGNDDERVMQGITLDRFNPLGYYTREQSIVTVLRLFRAKDA